MPTKRCCCDGPCTIGCCYPYEYLEEPTPGNYAKNLIWTVDAPYCAAIDGLTGNFSPETTGPHDPLLECGFCLCYINASDSAFVLGTARFEDGETCGSTPCGMTICFGLYCARLKPTTDTEDPERCCEGFRLIVLYNAATPTGGLPVDLKGLCFEGDPLASNPNFPGCNGESQNSVDNGTELSPTTCQCADPEADPPVPFELVFDLSVLGFGCATTFPSGPCVGLSTCCLPNSCSFTGATLTVTEA